MLDVDDLDYVRLLIGDTGTIPSEQLFTDRDITVMVTREGSLKLAAAQLLDRVAGTELLLAKKITTQDLGTDGPAVAKELRALATELRAQEAAAAAREDGDVWGLDTFTMGGQRSRPEGTEVAW